MRFLIVLKSAEDQGTPPPELFAAIEELGREATKAGVLVETGGLHPSATGTRLRLSGGKLTVTDGPFTESKELIASYAMYELRSKEEAVEWTRRFMQAHQQHWPEWEGEAEIRQVFGPVDFGPQS